MVPGSSGLNDFRAFRDVALSGQPTPAIVSVVALPTAFARLTQVAPQLATDSLIPPDILIDRLMAHATLHQFETTDNPDNLLR